MKYDDEKLLNIEGYENMAKAYSTFLKEKGFIILKVDDSKNQKLFADCVELLATIKTYLFRLGGFYGTGKLYNLTDKQCRKLETIFDIQVPKISPIQYFDKTKCFLKYIGYEFALLKNLIEIKDQSNFESDILRIINDRLLLLQKIFTG